MLRDLFTVHISEHTLCTGITPRFEKRTIFHTASQRLSYYTSMRMKFQFTADTSEHFKDEKKYETILCAPRLLNAPREHENARTIEPLRRFSNSAICIREIYRRIF
jgi:hypothetical protein